MQLLFTESEEFGKHKGLDVVSGKVVRFRPDVLKTNGGALKIPHMGWNGISIKRPSPVLDGVDDGSHLYFVHSYYVEPKDQSMVCTATEYGGSFVSSITKDNVFACQFHPEKSQEIGLRLLRNFGRQS
jgi:glutamine amidotransferase